ncbi:SdpI family protein [Luteococcus sp. Sow4_B9]|uniref:SdpI family protein n=1 Tax=Luteococcus sp. Sow4_B9 TaxID=3438792 RepID=UPI003F9A71D4
MLASVMLVLGTLLWVMSWQGSSRRVSPNSLLGIRTPRTQRSQEAWHAGQEAASRWLGRASAVMMVGGLVLLAMVVSGATPVGVNIVALPLFGLVAWCFVRAVQSADEAAGKQTD